MRRGEMSVWRCERKWGEMRAKEWRTLQKARRWAHNGGGKDRGKEKKTEREPHWRKRGGRSKKTNIREKTRKGKNTSSCCPCLNCVPGYEQVLVIVLSLWSQWRFPCLVREMWFHICIAALYSPCVGLYSLRRRLISIGIPIINLRRSSDRLRFIMGIPIPGVFLVNRGPGFCPLLFTWILVLCFPHGYFVHYHWPNHERSCFVHLVRIISFWRRDVSGFLP